MNTLEAFENKIERRARLFVLRVVYVRSVVEDSSLEPTVGAPPQLTCKTFRPAIVENDTCCGSINVELEGLQETTQRVNEWLVEGGENSLHDKPNYD